MNTFYLTIEGGDGSGKTTLVKNLHNHFISDNKSILLTKEFGSPHDKFCKELRDFALSDQFSIDEEAGQILFASIIKQHQEKVIKPSLGKYDVILSDRGPYSNYAYGPVHGLTNEFISSLFNLVYQKAAWPDLSIFIHTPAEVADERRRARSPEQFAHGGVDRIEAKGLEFQKKIINNFIEMAEVDRRLIILNVTPEMGPQDVLESCLSIIKKHI